MSGMLIRKKCPQCGRIYQTTFPNSNPWAEDFLATGIDDSSKRSDSNE